MGNTDKRNVRKSKRLLVKKVIALIAVAAAVINLVLMAMGVIEPYVFMMVVLFLFLLSYTYYSGDDAEQ